MAEQVENGGRGGWDRSRAALGAVLVLAGVIVLIDISLVASISAMLIGAIAVIAGVVTAIQGFNARGWVGLAAGLAIGSLYVAFGVLLINSAWFRAAFMTLALAGTLINSGILRVLLGAFRWSTYCWLILSGIIAIVGGTLILLPNPATGLEVIALILGADFIVHGLAWIFIARPKVQPAMAP